MYVENERGEVEFIFDIQDRSQDTFGNNKDNTFLIDFNQDLDIKNSFLELKMTKNAMLGFAVGILHDIYKYEQNDYHVDSCENEDGLSYYTVGMHLIPKSNDMHLYYD